MIALLFAYASLGDPLYDVREAAEVRLTHLVSRYPAIYGPRLGEWCRGATCPEVRSRSLRVLAVYDRWRVVSYVPSGVPCWPISDAFPLPCVVLPAFALEDVRDKLRWPLRYSGRSPGPAWNGYRRTTEENVRERLRAGATWEEADELLARMMKLELRSRSDCGVELQLTGWAGGYLGRVPSPTSP